MFNFIPWLRFTLQLGFILLLRYGLGSMIRVVMGYISVGVRIGIIFIVSINIMATIIVWAITIVVRIMNLD